MQFNPSYLQYDLLQGHHCSKDSHLIYPLNVILFFFALLDSGEYILFDLHLSLKKKKKRKKVLYLSS